MYAPASQLVRDDVSVLESFHNDVSAVPMSLKTSHLYFRLGTETPKYEKRANNMPVTIASEFLVVVFETILDNILSISAQSANYSSAMQPFNTKLPI